MRKILLYFMSFIFIINSIFYINVYATEEGQEMAEVTEENQEISHTQEKCKAIVTKIGETKEVGVDSYQENVQEVTIEILDGTYEKKEFTTDCVISYNMAENIERYELEVGDKVEVEILEDSAGNITVTIQDIVRDTYIIAIFCVLILCIFLICGKHAIKPILSLIATAFCVYFLIKIISKNYSILMTILILAVYAIIQSIISNGFNKKVWIVTFGALIGVLCSTVLSMIFMHLAKISGYSGNEILSDYGISDGLNYKNLMILGTIIVSFGVCMNTAMFILSSLDDMRNETKDILWAELLKSGINKGKDIVAKMCNMLILAYIGVMLLEIVIYATYYNGVFEAFSQEIISVGIVSVLSGCIGVVLAVPITSVLYAIFNRKKTRYKTTSDNKLDGKRSLKI